MDEQKSSAMQALADDIRSAAQDLEGIKCIHVAPHCVDGHFICRIELEPNVKRDRFKRRFDGTAAGNSVYFTRTLPKAA